LLVSNLGLDVLYPISLTGSDVQLYAGDGANVRFFAYYPNGFDLRGVFGAEYRLPSAATPPSLFAEVRLYLRGLLAGFPTAEGRAGVNFPF
jgi:hypothetical protein